ncbi:MAG: hypothetical protein IKL25_09245 [Clostridia bacterium]|nr:hypothetical protein [Clostridia bacterium]
MMEKIKNIYGAHPITWTLCILAFVIAVGALIFYFPAFSLEAADVPVHACDPTEKGEEIPIGGVVTIAQADGRTLTLDTETMVITLTDDATGISWTSAMSGAAADNLGANALLQITFRGEDNVETVWNTYQNCVLFKDYRIFRIANGVRIEMDINEGDSKVYLEYLPARFPRDRYENFILPGVKKLLDDGVIDEKQYQRYLDMLHQCYRLNPRANAPDATPAEQSYDQFFSGTSPAVTTSNALIGLAGMLGYTRDMLIEDCAVFGTIPTFHEPAQFSLVIELTLDGGDLVAHIPTEEITASNPFYKMQRIAVLPNFVALPAAAENDGYFLTPDGSGALLRFNTFTGSMTKYDRPYMDNDFFVDYYFQSEFAQELRMPIFGVINGVEPSTHGMLAIIEKGAETANLHISLGTTAGSGKKATYTGINAAYVSVDTLEHAKVRINGAYEPSSPTYVSDSGHIAMDFTVRYKPFTSEVTYFDMAMAYRDFLSAQSGVEIAAPQGPVVYVEVLGAVTLTDRFIGIPYDNITSMSTYKDVMQVIEALPAGSVVQYNGGFNGGMISELNDGARLVKENGSTEELQAMLAAAEQKGIPFYWQINLSRVYDPGRTYVPYLHASRDFSNEAAEIYLYTPDTAKFNGRWDPIRPYTILSPKYLPYVADKFLAGLQKQGLDINLAIGDLGHDVFADYRYNNVVNPVHSNSVVGETIHKLNADAALVLNDPSAEYAPLADYVVNIPRTSSNYASFAATVPFRQLALSGLTNVVGTDVNLNSRSLDYYLLQAAELGVGVKYTVSVQNSDILKSSHFESLYAIYWNEWDEEILRASDACAELRGIIGGQQIVNHEILAEDVFQTTYENGVRIITNYSALPYESEDGVVEAGTYLIVQEGGAL